MAIKVLVVDDEALVRHALRIFVDSSELLEVVGEATNGVEAIQQCQALAPDVVLMDIQMPRMNGIEAIRAVTSAMPEVKTIAVTTFSAERHIVAALQAGASGYLVKDSSPDAVIQAILDVAEGRSALSPQVTRELVSMIQGDTGSPLVRVLTQLEPLTARELSIVEKLALGKSNAEIADDLHLAEATVKANLHRVMRKWDVRDRVQVLITAVRRGLVTI